MLRCWGGVTENISGFQTAVLLETVTNIHIGMYTIWLTALIVERFQFDPVPLWRNKSLIISDFSVNKEFFFPPKK